MADTNDQADVTAEDTGDTNTADTSKDSDTTTKDDGKSNRANLTDEEMLATLEGRTKRLRTKLGLDKKDDTQGSTQDNKSVELAQKAFLRSASITDPDEVKLALDTAKKWGMDVDQVVDDEDFTVKLEKLRTKKSNDAAASNVRGNGNSKSANQTPEFYIARGTPPTREEVSDRKTRASIARAMVKNSENAKVFYSD